MKRFLAIVLITALFTSCANQSQQAKTEGTAVGAAGGAAIGAIIGKVIGDDTGMAIGAAVGALAGGLIGYNYAARMDKHRKELEGRENNIDARIEFARAMNSETKAYNDTLEQEISATMTQVQEQKLTQQELAKKKQELEATTNEAIDELAKIENDLRGMKTYRQKREVLIQQNLIADQGESNVLDQEIAKMEAHLEQLRQNTTALASLSQRI